MASRQKLLSTPHAVVLGSGSASWNFISTGAPPTIFCIYMSASDLRRLRRDAWQYFVAPENRKVFVHDCTIDKIHPVTGEVLLSYNVLGDKDFRMAAPASPLTTADWRRVLCTGRCKRTGATSCRKPFLGLECVAECLQLHPQAAVLSPVAIADVLK